MNSIIKEILTFIGPIIAGWLVTEGGKLITWFNALDPKIHGVIAIALTYFAAAASGQPVTQDWVLAAYQALLQLFFPVQQALKAHRATRGLAH
jgi:hypothetical protein